MSDICLQDLFLGELLKLGFSVSERTISRYLPKRRPKDDAIKRWITFLKNHKEAISAMDFFTVPTASFRILYVFFIISHGRRKIMHFNVTDHPYSEWVILQLRDSFPYDTAPKYLIYDRDSIFSDRVTGTVNIKAVLESQKLSMDSIVKATIYLTDLFDFQAVNGIYGSYFGSPAPARATIGVSTLPKGVKVEIEAIAWKGKE